MEKNAAPPPKPCALVPGRIESAVGSGPARIKICEIRERGKGTAV
jgi:hypothetical protein